MIKIAHLTSVHSREDTRVFIKQCRSLAANGYSVTLVVADGKGDEIKDAVNVVDVGRPPGRVSRVFRTTRRVLDAAIALDADLYHLHDPELIPIGLSLKRRSRRVIFDSHEDVPKQLLSKPYLGPVKSQVLARSFSVFERYACRKLDGIVTATPAIREKFQRIHSNVVDINNFPVLGELDAQITWGSKRKEICYVGAISRIRGILETVGALARLRTSAKLNLVGRISDTDLEKDVRSLPGWQLVNDHGFLDRDGVRNVLSRSMAGIVIFHPLQNHIDAQPNKMFEYMSAGVPVIASDFPLWRDIIDRGECGLCVDPLDQDAIAAAIDQIVENPEQARVMGDNGRRAVASTYNWPAEESKLLAFYRDILQRDPK